MDKSGIEYALVARKNIVLAEYARTSGNFKTFTEKILNKIDPAKSNKMTYVYDNFSFNYLIEDGLTYLCMTKQSFSQRLSFAFLEDIKNKFRSAYGDRGRTALPMGMQADFCRVIQTRMDFYSSDPNADKIIKVQSDIDDVKNVMVQNIEKVLERGEKIELLVEKTEAMNDQAMNFKKSSTSLKRAMWWKNVKLWIIVILIGLVLLYFLISIICGGLNWKNCVHKSDKK